MSSKEKLYYSIGNNCLTTEDSPVRKNVPCAIPFKYKNNFAALKGGGRRWNNKNNSYFIQNRCITAELFLRIV